MLWLIIAFIAIAVIYKNINKEEDWAESIGFTIALLLLTSWIWIPVTEKIPAPGSYQTITYQAEAAVKPTVKSPSTSDKYMEVVETVSEAKLGTKKVYRSLILNSKHETVLTKAQPAVYRIKLVENPNYQPPKPIYTPAPPVQRQSGCPVTACCDGTCSWSTGRGTCSWYGGVCG